MYLNIYKLAVWLISVLSITSVSWSQSSWTYIANMTADQSIVCPGEETTIYVQTAREEGNPGIYMLWTEDLSYKLVGCYDVCEVAQELQPTISGGAYTGFDITRERCGSLLWGSKFSFKVKPTQTTTYQVFWVAKHTYETNVGPGCPRVQEVYTRVYTGSIEIKVAVIDPPQLTPSQLIFNQTETDKFLVGRGRFVAPYPKMKWYKYECSEPEVYGPVELGWNTSTWDFNDTMPWNVASGKIGSTKWKIIQIDNGCPSTFSNTATVTIKPCGINGGGCNSDIVDFVEAHSCNESVKNQPDYHFYDNETTVCQGANCDINAYWDVYKSDMSNQLIIQTDQLPVFVADPYGSILSQLLFPEGTYNRPLPTECETIKLPRPYSWAVTLGRMSKNLPVRALSTIVAAQGAGIVSNFDPVFVKINDFQRCVTNYTLPGHIFYPGKVTRCMIKYCDEIKIVTYGEGTTNFVGDFAEWLGQKNDVWGERMFKNVDMRAAEFLRAHFEGNRPAQKPLLNDIARQSLNEEKLHNKWELKEFKIKYPDLDSVFTIYTKEDTVNFWNLRAINFSLKPDGSYTGFQVMNGAVTGTWSYNEQAGALTMDTISISLQWDSTRFTLSGNTAVFIDTTLSSAQYFMTFQPAADTVIWKGIVSSDWQNPLNWNTGRVPDEYSDVIVSEVVPFNPVLTIPARVKSLTIMNNQHITLNSNLTLMGKK